MISKHLFLQITEPADENLSGCIKTLLDSIQKNLYDIALERRTENVAVLDEEDFTEFCTALDNKKIIMAPFCGLPACEENIKVCLSLFVVV